MTISTVVQITINSYRRNIFKFLTHNYFAIFVKNIEIYKKNKLFINRHFKLINLTTYSSIKKSPIYHKDLLH